MSGETNNESKITKIKSTGRIESGKRLAEWNRKNKENLIKNKEQLDTSQNQVPSSQSTSQNQVPASTYNISPSYYLLAVGFCTIIGFGLYQYQRRQTQTQTQCKIPVPPSKNDDIFKMN